MEWKTSPKKFHQNKKNTMKNIFLVCLTFLLASCSFESEEKKFINSLNDASKNCDEEALLRLISKGFDINGGGNEAPLVVATRNGKVECVRTLLNNGANPFVETSSSGTYTNLVARPLLLAKSVIIYYASYNTEQMKTQLDKSSNLYEIIVEKKIPLTNFKEIEQLLIEAESKWKK